MTITILGVGDLKEKYWREACEEYRKRLSRYCSVDLIFVEDEPAAERLSDGERKLVLQREGARLLKRLPKRDFVAALDIRGKRMDSEGFSAWLEETSVSSGGRLCFVIGGSLGLSEEILARADVRLSFSDLTFPHQMMRVILLEQIYRGFRILRGEPYHK